MAELEVSLRRLHDLIMLRGSGGSRVAVVAGEEEEEADGKRKISTQVRHKTPRNRWVTGRGWRLIWPFIHALKKGGGQISDPNAL